MAELTTGVKYKIAERAHESHGKKLQHQKHKQLCSKEMKGVKDITAHRWRPSPQRGSRERSREPTFQLSSNSAFRVAFSWKIFPNNFFFLHSFEKIFFCEACLEDLMDRY